MKYVGVIVTYNRKELLMNNLSMLDKQTEQLDKVIIIDNHSTDGTQKLVESVYSNRTDWIDYRYMNENTGGAGGFYYGVKFAYEDGADFIYLMDDDGKPYNETTFERIKRAGIKLYEENHLIFLNSLVTTNGTDLSFGFWPYVSLKKQIEKVHERAKDNIFMGRVNPFNGTLVSRELVEKIGYPRKEFFLSRDETDYMHRSVEAGATVATVIDSIYCHPSSKLECKKIGKLYVTIYQDLDREYYALRNVTYTYKDINKKRVIGICCIRFLTILLYEDQKVLRIKQIKIAVSDAKNNRMGKRGRK